MGGYIFFSQDSNSGTLVQSPFQMLTKNILVFYEEEVVARERGYTLVFLCSNNGYHFETVLCKNPEDGRTASDHNIAAVFNLLLSSSFLASTPAKKSILPRYASFVLP